MAGIVEIANSAFEERDKALERLALLMKQAERERHPKMEDVNDLSAIVENVEETKSTERIQVTIQDPSKSSKKSLNQAQQNI